MIRLDDELSGVDCATKYRKIYDVPRETCVYVVRDSRLCECYHCSTSRAELEALETKTCKIRGL